MSLRDILEDLPHAAPEWWSGERAEYLLNQMSPRHREVAEHMMRGSDWSYGTVFRRMRKGKSMAELRTDDIAGCLRTPRGGSGRQIVFKAGNGEYHVRLMTPREAARLMGADDYAISVSLNQALFGFGDAVCVPVIEWIATHYLNPVVSEFIHGYPLGSYESYVFRLRISHYLALIFGIMTVWHRSAREIVHALLSQGFQSSRLCQ